MTKTNGIILKKNENDGNKSLKKLYEYDDSILKNQYKKYINLIKHFKQTYNHNTFKLFSSPGRVEIGGNHTDHQNGCVIAAAVNVENIAIAAKNNSAIIQVSSKGFSKFSIDINDLSIDKSKFYTSESLVRGICARLKNVGYKIEGFDVYINSGVPLGSGLSSSAAFEVLIGKIISSLFNNGTLSAVENAMTGQWAENNHFGKPCGLMDQIACSVGGLIFIDFKNPQKPLVKKIDFDFMSTGYTLVITETGGSHANLNQEYASLPIEMKSVANEFGKDVLRNVSLPQIIKALPTIRKKTGDRALLRSIHFQEENARVLKQVKALKNKDFKLFLSHIIQSGYSSFMYNQNIYTSGSVKEQSMALGLALSELILNCKGAWRVHGGGFAGTILAFVPKELLDTYITTMENVFGKTKSKKLLIREVGAIEINY